MDKIFHHCLADYDLQEYECQLLTSDKVPISSGDWQSLITSQTSTILSIRIRLLSLEKPKSEDRFSDDGSESSDSEQEPGLGKPPTRSYTKDSTMGRAGAAEINRARRGTSMALTKRTPTSGSSRPWKSQKDAEKYDTHSTKREEDWRLTEYHESNSPPPNRIPKYPIPPSSGVVVNKLSHREKKPPYADTTSDIYFTPRNTETSEHKSTGSFLHNEDGTEPRTKTLDDEGIHVRSVKETAVPSKPQESDARSASLIAGDVKLHVPPVFTWAVGKRTETPEHLEGDSSSEDTKSIERDDKADANYTAAEEQYVMADPSREEEETLDNVSNHINSQLLGMRPRDESVIYKNTTTASLFDVEKMVKDVMKTTVLALMNRSALEEPETDSDTPAWHRDMKEAASILFKLFDYFIPLAYPCDVADKFWGAIQEMFTVGTRTNLTPSLVIEWYLIQ
jgi:hypothetical protein